MKISSTGAEIPCDKRLGPEDEPYSIILTYLGRQTNTGQPEDWTIDQFERQFQIIESGVVSFPQNRQSKSDAELRQFKPDLAGLTELKSPYRRSTRAHVLRRCRTSH